MRSIRVPVISTYIHKKMPIWHALYRIIVLKERKYLNEKGSKIKKTHIM